MSSNQEKGEQVIKNLRDFLDSLGIKKKGPELTRAKHIDIYRSTPE